jgi:kumamolisin
MAYRFFSVLLASLTLLVSPLLGGVTQAQSRLPFFSLASSRQFTDPYSPAQIEAAYNFGSLTSQGIDGAGQTIALIEIDKFNAADIQQFDAKYQLPSPSIRQIYLGGKTFKLGGSGETTLDLEWAHALAPGAALQVYYIKNNQSSTAGWKSLAQAVKLAAANGAQTISMSFGTCGASSGYKTTKTALAGLLKKGVSVFVSSGDTGALPGPVHDCGRHLGVGYPASDPSVTAVGGTSLVLNLDNTVNDEVAWSLSGGGKGAPLPRPSWQAVVARLAGAKYRWGPDVSFVADPRTGVAIYYKGQEGEVGGTSLGAPGWAAIWSLVRENAQKAGKTVAAASPTLYRIANSSAYSQALNDITDGDNGYYQATAGWDPVTGWGSPNASGLATAVAAVSATAR